MLLLLLPFGETKINFLIGRAEKGKKDVSLFPKILFFFFFFFFLDKNNEAFLGNKNNMHVASLLVERQNVELKIGPRIWGLSLNILSMNL